MDRGSTSLADYLSAGYLAERPGLTGSYRALMLATCRQLSGWVGRDVELREIDRALLAAWAEDLLGSIRPCTVNDKLRMIRTVILAAYEDGLLQQVPRRVRRIVEQAAPPEAWTVEEVRRLLGHLTILGGELAGRPASDWWLSLVMTIYWTGTRIGAMLGVEVADYQRGIGLVARKQKNGRQQWHRLPQSCCEAIERILPESGSIWHWPMHRNTLFTRFRAYVEAAGLPCPRSGRNLFHRLRRTTASYCAAVDPGIAQRQLDHSSLRVTQASYIDPRIARPVSAADVLPEVLPEPQLTLRVIG